MTAELPVGIREKITLSAPPAGRPVIGPCWIWTGGKTTAGYGTTTWGGTKQYLHRITHTVYIGQIPDRLQIDHLCRVVACCNPNHIEAVTTRVNVLRGLIGMKTECVNGHPLSGDNLVWSNNGPSQPRTRRCRTCANNSQRRTWARYGTERNAVRRDQYVPRRDPSQCANGHDRAEHTRVSPGGRRICRQCERGRKMRYLAKSAITAGAS